jgi:hypothetical protein
MFRKDFEDFRYFVSRVLEKDSHYPYKFESFNKEETERWEHLFSSWHVTSPLEPLYIERESFVENIVTGLYKLEASLEEICDKFEEERGEEGSSNGNRSEDDSEEKMSLQTKEGNNS